MGRAMAGNVPKNLNQQDETLRGVPQDLFTLQRQPGAGMGDLPNQILKYSTLYKMSTLGKM